MPKKLRDSVQIQTLARDLKIRPGGNAVSDIIAFCDRKIAGFMVQAPDCTTLSDTLDWVAAKAGTVFEVARSNEGLLAIRDKYARFGELGFATVVEEFSDDVFGITFKRLKRDACEPLYVSVIDSRGQKAVREYFTKWHEVAHLLTQTDQLRLSFRRTHCSVDVRTPEESLMDVIAGHCGYRPPSGFEFKTNEISFEAIEDLRQQLCPDASKQSALISLVKFWPVPCALLSARMGLRASEVTGQAQHSFGFLEEPKEALRAVSVTISDAGREAGLFVPRNMRVPAVSVIHSVFEDEIGYGEAEEDLSWWESSDGRSLPPCRVLIKARRSWDSVEALIVPVTE